MKYLILIIISLMPVGLWAQIGINTETPHVSSVLDIDTYNNDKGLLLPRMTNSQKLAIVNPEPSLMVYDTDNKCISQYKDTPSNPGSYTWTCLTLYNRHFLYMPSVNVPTADAAGNLLTGTQNINLYNIYNTGLSAPKIKNMNAPVSIPFFSVDQLNYYVTYCDPCITVVSISNAGVLSYTVNKLPDYDAFMNIVFTLR